MRSPFRTIFHRAFISLYCLAALSASLQAAEVDCRWMDKAIWIEGKADEAAWRQAVVIEDFKIPGMPPGKPRSTTKARLLWDREYLYFFAEMQDVDLVAEVKEHNGPIWEKDAFELFFKPADDKPGYYEFEVNPLNTTMELFLPARDTGGWLKFKDVTHIEMKTAVVVRGTLNQSGDKDEGWSVEGRIPWRDLSHTGGRPNPGERWKFALCRVDASAGKAKPELSSCAPLTRPDFHHYEDYATLRFVGPETEHGKRASGFERRPLWTKSRVVGYPDPLPPYSVERVFAQIKVAQPVYLLEEPDSKHLLLPQHLGSWSAFSTRRRSTTPSASQTPG